MAEDQDQGVQEIDRPVASPYQALGPRKVTAADVDLEDAAEILRNALEPHVHGLEEKATFRVRPGVTLMYDRNGEHRVVEVLLRDKVMGFSTQQIAQKVEMGTLDIFAQGILEKLRSRLSFHAPVSYRRVDVLREIVHEFERAIRGLDVEVGAGTPGLKEGTAGYYSEQLDLLREGVRRAIERAHAPVATEAIQLPESGTAAEEELAPLRDEPVRRQRRPFERKKA